MCLCIFSEPVFFDSENGVVALYNQPDMMLLPLVLHTLSKHIVFLFYWVLEASFIFYFPPFINRTRKSSAASTYSTATTRARDARRQRKRGKIRPGRYIDMRTFQMLFFISYNQEFKLRSGTAIAAAT